MKQILIYIILIFFSFTSCQKQKNEVFVKGKFISEIPEEITYSVPVNGICYEFYNSSTEVDSLGNFEFRIQTETPCFITLFLMGNRGNLVVEPGENYNLTIESKDYENQLKFECNNIKLQEEYQKLISPMHPQFESMKFLNSPISVTENKIDSLYDEEISIFKKLKSDKIISADLFDLISLDRKTYYASVLQQIATMKFVNTRRQNFETNTDSINKVWNESVTSIPLNSSNFLKSKWAYYYIQNYLLHQEYFEDGFNWEVRPKVRKEERFHTYIIDIAKRYLTGDVLEFYDAAYILSSARQHKFEIELINLNKEFEIDFPESNYSKYLNPVVQEIVEFHDKVAQKKEEEIKFIDNPDSIKTFADCIETLKGNKIYVDVWSTSCGPCKKEFEHNEELQKLLKSKNIKKLYVSIDNDANKERWNDMIIYYNLEGYHIRANKNLYADMNSLFGISSIPRYLLIDENGEVISADAKRPSELKELEKQIEEK